MWRLLSGIALVVLAAAAYHHWMATDRYAGERAAAAALPGKEILLAVCWHAEDQDEVVDGVTLAVKEINAAGGAGGRQLRLLRNGATAAFPETRRTAAVLASRAELTAVIGGDNPDLAAALSGIYEQAGLLNIVVGAGDAALARHGFKYLVQAALADDLAGPLLAAEAIRRGRTRFAVVFEERAVSEQKVLTFESAAVAAGGGIVYRRPYLPREVSFPEVARDLKDLREPPDLVLFAGSDADASNFLAAIRSMGVEAPVIGPLRRQDAGDFATHLPEGFVRAFQSDFHRTPGPLAVLSYDMVKRLAWAAAQTGSADPLTLSTWIRYGDGWIGVGGAYRIDVTGKRIVPPG